MQRSSVPIIRLTWDQLDLAVLILSDRVRAALDPHRRVPGLYGEPRGGLTLAVALSHRLRLPLLSEPEERMIWVDDIVDSGETVERVVFQSNPFACLSWVWSQPVMRRVESLKDAPLCLTVEPQRSGWYVFPWEDPHQAAKEYDDYMSRRRAP